MRGQLVSTHSLTLCPTPPGPGRRVRSVPRQIPPKASSCPLGRRGFVTKLSWTMQLAMGPGPAHTASTTLFAQARSREARAPGAAGVWAPVPIARLQGRPCSQGLSP